jgi:hypothetical protein
LKALGHRPICLRRCGSRTQSGAFAIQILPYSAANVR